MDIVIDQNGKPIACHEEDQRISASAYGDGFRVVRAASAQFRITEEGDIEFIGVTADDLPPVTRQIDVDVALALLAAVPTFTDFAAFKVAVTNAINAR